MCPNGREFVDLEPIHDHRGIQMTDRVSVRMYNVGFGDCFVLTLPGPTRPRSVLIDCGRHVGTLMDAPPFWDVVNQVVADLPLLDGKPFIDVLVMTHRHRDHVHGFSRPDVWKDVGVGEVWMPWTESTTDPVALELRNHQDQSAARAVHALRAFGVKDSAPILSIALNSLANQDAMDTLAGFGCTVQYLPEPLRPQATCLTGVAGADTGLPAGVNVHVLGPPRDTRTIVDLAPPAGASYLRLVPPADDGVATSDGPGSAAAVAVPAPWGGRWDIDRATYQARIDAAVPKQPGPPPAGGYLSGKLLDQVERSAFTDAESLAMSVDHALNGTSLVLLFEVGDIFLLFSGDAQWGTWDAILRNPVWTEKLKKVRFVKIGHHGSHNGTPVEFVEKYLHDSVAMVSVSPTGYTAKGWKQIPKQELLQALEEQGRVGLLVRSDVLGAPSERVLRHGADPPLWVEVHFDVGGAP